MPDQCQAASYIRACAGSGVNATANFGGDAVEEALLGEKLGGPDDYFIRNRPVVYCRRRQSVYRSKTTHTVQQKTRHELQLQYSRYVENIGVVDLTVVLDAD